MELRPLLSVYAVLWGAVWGSFLNVVIHRVPRGLSIVRPRSRCPNCERKIAAIENIPLLSYLVLRGRCRGCGERISPRYVLVEALTAILALLLLLKCAGGGRLEGPSPWQVLLPFLFYFAFVCAALAVAFIDLELTVIPDQITIPTALLGLACALILPRGGVWADFHPAPTWVESLLGIGLGIGIVAAITVTYRLLTGHVGMGGGDATTLAMIGGFLGWQSLLFVLFFASAQGVVAAVGVALLERFGGRRSAFLLRGVHRPEFWSDEGESRGPDEAGERSADPADPAAEGSVAEEEDTVSFGKTGLPFGPFLALAGIEYLFVGAFFERWLMGGVV